MKQIVISTWNKGLQKVSLNKFLQNAKPCSLSEAKVLVDGLLEDRPIDLGEFDDETANLYVSKIESMNACCFIREVK